jgi:hypothetical protein
VKGEIAMKTCEETADQLAQLYDGEFNGKKRGRFRIARSSLAMLSNRQYIEQTTVEQIKLLLSEKHGLLMIDLHDEFSFINSNILRRYRKATTKVLEDVLGFSCDSEVIDDEE